MYALCYQELLKQYLQHCNNYQHSKGYENVYGKELFEQELLQLPGRCAQCYQQGNLVFTGGNG